MPECRIIFCCVLNTIYNNVVLVVVAVVAVVAVVVVVVVVVLCRCIKRKYMKYSS